MRQDSGRKTMRRLRYALLAGGGLLALGLANSGAAHADGYGDADGFTATARVHFSGDAAPGGGGGGSTMTLSVPAKCWYDTAPGAGLPGAGASYNPNDALSVQKAWELAVAAGGNDLPPKSVIDEAVAAQAAGKSRVFMMYWCYDPSVDAGTNPIFNSAARYIFTGDGIPVPPPLVDPKDLADVAIKHMVLPTPQIERNPKIAAQGGGTLVQLPTWFWVTNPDSVGGPDGKRTIRAEIVGTPVFAEVTATTDGLTITSPAGGTSCPPTVATRGYTAGASDSNGCTLAFSHASIGYSGGYPVTASTAWTATWTGRTQGGAAAGGPLAGQGRSVTVDVPVAESQALVGSAR